jgi:hypothetical protein
MMSVSGPNANWNVGARSAGVSYPSVGTFSQAEASQ